MSQPLRILFVLALLLAPTLASAQPRDLSVAKVDGRVIILVAYDDGVVSFQGNGESYHSYDFKPVQGARSSTLVDINLDGLPDFAAMGKASFILGADANPRMVLSDGCSDAFVYNFVGEKDLEFFCRSGGSLAMFAYDGTMLWELGISGMKLNSCRLVDMTGDNTPDIECEMSSKQFLQLGSDGSVISESNPTASDGTVFESISKPGTPLLATSPQAFDFDADGQAKETLSVHDKGADIVGPGGTLASIDFVPISAAIFDVDQDQKDELLLLGDDRLLAISSRGVAFDVSWSRSKLKREAAAELMTVGGRGLEADDQALRSALEAHLPSLAKCYAGKVKKNPFLGVGRMSLKAKLDKAGAVSDVELSFSTLNDADIDACVLKGVKKLSLVPGKSEDAQAIFDIEFGYRDR
ncbi:MAG: AgmX/PglI C-terminal domain-containing protein [Myxococcota bacterium]|jgi:hypothetical protein|nr:AgmX/PglI C-terminal domain-containing protein [Myxococcota bacterium]